MCSRGGAVLLFMLPPLRSQPALEPRCICDRTKPPSVWRCCRPLPRRGSSCDRTRTPTKRTGVRNLRSQVVLASLDIPSSPFPPQFFFPRSDRTQRQLFLLSRRPLSRDQCLRHSSRRPNDCSHLRGAPKNQSQTRRPGLPPAPALPGGPVPSARLHLRERRTGNGQSIGACERLGIPFYRALDVVEPRIESEPGEPQETEWYVDPRGTSWTCTGQD